MLKKSILVSIALILLTLSALAQKIVKPTLIPKEATAQQQKLINEGIRLHDEKLYDEAIAKYQEVLKENPDCDIAMYELALTYSYKKDHKKTIEIGYKLIQYKSKIAIAGYGIIANTLDDQGEPKKAIEIYQDAIKQLKNDAEYDEHVSSLYYNLGVTFAQQKLYKDSKEALKEAVNYNYNYNSPHYLISEVFFTMKYKVPALLAASRLLSLEINTPRSKRAGLIFQDVIAGGVSKGDNGNINIALDLDSPKDEGDFSGLSVIIGLLGAASDTSEENKNKSVEEKFVDQIESFISFLASDLKKTKSTFVGKKYIPYMLEMKQRGYVKPFAYLILQQNGNENAEKWMLNNSKQTIEFINWAKAYQLPAK